MDSRTVILIVLYRHVGRAGERRKRNRKETRKGNWVWRVWMERWEGEIEFLITLSLWCGS
jgi:hypothetical protein